MDTSHVRSLIARVDELIFAHTGEHLDDLEQALLEGAIDHQKYAEIAQNNHRSEKYVKDVASKLWQSLSAALGEEVNKSNIKSSLQRYYYSNFSNVVNSIQINRGNICTNSSENNLKNSEIYTQAELEAVTELFKEGLSIEQIARALQLSVERVKAQIDKPKID